MNQMSQCKPNLDCWSQCAQKKTNGLLFQCAEIVSSEINYKNICAHIPSTYCCLVFFAGLSHKLTATKTPKSYISLLNELRSNRQRPDEMKMLLYAQSLKTPVQK